MSKMRRRLLRITTYIICYGLLAVMMSCLGRTSLKAERISPTGKYSAELSEGETGGPGGWMSAIRIREVNSSRWTRLLGQEAHTVFGADISSAHLSLTWQSDNNLGIVCSSCDPAKILVKETSWREVKISYKIVRGNAQSE